MESDVDMGVEEELRWGKKSEEIRVKSEERTIIILSYKEAVS